MTPVWQKFFPQLKKILPASDLRFDAVFREKYSGDK